MWLANETTAVNHQIETLTGWLELSDRNLPISADSSLQVTPGKEREYWLRDNWHQAFSDCLNLQEITWESNQSCAETVDHI